MDKSFGSLLGSPIFTFAVGEEYAQDVLVHSGIVAEHSEALAKMIQEHWREGVEKYAELKGVDKDTFLRFCEYAYTHRYTDPVPELWDVSVNDVNSAVFPPALEEDDRESTAMPVRKSKKDKKSVEWSEWDVPRTELQIRKERIKKTFEEGKVNDHRLSCRCPQLNWQPPQFDDTRNYTNVFLSHAKVYVFADTYGVDPLKALALQKINAILKGFRTSPAHFLAVKELITFAFENTPPTENSVDSLRHLLTRYLVTQVDSLSTISSFYETLEEGGPFVSLFYRVLHENFMEG